MVLCPCVSKKSIKYTGDIIYKIYLSCFFSPHAALLQDFNSLFHCKNIFRTLATEKCSNETSERAKKKKFEKILQSLKTHYKCLIQFSTKVRSKINIYEKEQIWYAVVFYTHKIKK